MKLNGYRASHRNRWHLVKEGILNLQEFSFFEYALDSYDFDSRHEQFGTFNIDIEDIKTTLKVKETTVYNWIKKLASLGLIQETNKKRLYKIPNPNRYVILISKQGTAFLTSKEETNQPAEIIFQNIGIKSRPDKYIFQPDEKNSVVSASLSSPKDLISSKVNSNLSSLPSLFQTPTHTAKRVRIKGTIKAKEEYQRLFEQNPGGLSVEDMMWIDTKAAEDIEVFDGDEERIIKTYFQGSRSEYEKHIVRSG